MRHLDVVEQGSGVSPVVAMLDVGTDRSEERLGANDPIIRILRDRHRSVVVRGQASICSMLKTV